MAPSTRLRSQPPWPSCRCRGYDGTCFSSPSWGEGGSRGRGRAAASFTALAAAPSGGSRAVGQILVRAVWTSAPVPVQAARGGGGHSLAPPWPIWPDCRRTYIFPMTTTSRTSGRPLRHSPRGTTPSNLTSGPSGFCFLRSSAGGRRPTQVLAP